MIDDACREAIEATKELVSIESLSGMERDIAYAINDLLYQNGVDKAFIDRYGNVIGVIEGGIDKTIVFEGHTDHVPPGDTSKWITDPYKPVIVDNKIYGRGVVDMKAAIASMIKAVSLVKGRDLPSIYLVFVPYEEISEGTLFGKALEETLSIKPDLVVLGEATDLDIAIGHRGRCVVETCIEGCIAHASMPDLGVNALETVAYFITRLSGLREKLPSHRVLGRSSLSPTVIECSPSSPPVIPGYCRLFIDYRMVVGETRESIISMFRDVLDSIRRESLLVDYSVGIACEEAVMWTGVRVYITHYYPAWLYESRIVDRIANVLRVVNPSIGLRVWRFSTDGVYSAGLRKYPTIGFGPGDESLAHRVNEYVPLEHICIAVRGYKAIMENAGLILGSNT